jgi:hypothetical protein
MIFHHYKCRAEIFYDICKFHTWLAEYDDDDDIRLIDNNVESDPVWYNSYWEFKSNLCYIDLLLLFVKADKEVGDLHIMCETLTRVEDFTGERMCVEERLELEGESSSDETEPDVETH